MKRTLFGMVFLCALYAFLRAPAALATAAQDRMAEEYLKAVAEGRVEALIDFFHPAEIEDLRARVMKALEAENAAGSGAVRKQLFGIVTSLEEARRITPANLFILLARRVGLPTEKAQTVKALGQVEENSQLAHVLVRLTPPKDSSARSHLAVVSLIRHGKGWRVALPFWFQTRVDALLAGQADKSGMAGIPASASPAPPTGVPNTPEILDLLTAGSTDLRAGDCAAYFNSRMSPGFRASTSAPAMKSLIAQCQRSEDTRETYIEALELAKRLSPTYEQSGARALYDMRGQGLPFEKFVLEKVGGQWYVAE